MGDCRREGGKLVLEGEFTIEHAAALKDCLSDAAAAGRPLLVDLAGVTRADVSLFQLLASLAKTLRERDAELQCSGMNEHLSSLAASAGVKDALPLRID